MRRSDLGQRLYERRTALGRSRQDVASAAHLDPSYLQYLEEQPGWPARETIVRLALALDTSPNALLGYQERKAPALPALRRPAAVGSLS